MKPKKLIAAAKLAWLNEIGVDTHWLSNADSVPTIKTDSPAENNQSEQISKSAKNPAKLPIKELAGTATKVSTDAQVKAPANKIEQLPVNFSELDTLDKLSAAVLIHIQASAAAVRPVLGSGTIFQPRYMFIGEQPGLDDSDAGKPFAGAQAQLLEAIFKAVKLPEADSCYMTHLLKYRLPNGIEPDEQQIKHNLPYLKQEIALIQPQNIIALGRVAASALLDGADLKELRGQMHYYQQPDGSQIPLWISHQPVALLVHGARKDQAWRDFIAIAKFNKL